MPRRLNDWSFFTTSDSVHWDVALVAPAQSQAGLSHFAPTALYNYGWSPPRYDFTWDWEADAFVVFGGTGTVQNGSYKLERGAGLKAILYGSHNLEDNLGKYRVPMIVADGDIEAGITLNSAGAGSHAGLLLRCSNYTNELNAVRGHYLGVNPEQARLELARLSNSYTVVASCPLPVKPGVPYTVAVSLRGSYLQVRLPPCPSPVLTFDGIQESDGAVGLANYDADASCSHFYVTPLVLNGAESWRGYPQLTPNPRMLTPLEWKGDDRPYSDMDLWYAWWYEHLPKNPGTHEVVEPASGNVLGTALNSWWPYIFDINVFDSSFLPVGSVATPAGDTLQPGRPQNLRAFSPSSTSLALAWDEPADNVGVTRYDIYRDGWFLRRTALRSLLDEGLSPATTYSYQVLALDGSGNTSPLSDAVSVATVTSDFPLKNPDFEAGLDVPVPWTADVWSPSAKLVWEPVGAGRNGSRCISIDATAAMNDARWIQTVSGLIPNGRYQLGGWVKGRDIALDQGSSVGANFCEFGSWNHSSAALSGTFDWTHLTLYLNADAEGKVTIGCRLGYWANLAKGQAWFDDLSLEYAPAVPVPCISWGALPHALESPPGNVGNAVAISSGAGHCVALLVDGSVVCWGDNSSLQATVPAGLAQVVSVAAGDRHSLAAKADGTVVAWGSNESGQCTVPSALTDVLSVAAGSDFSLALRGDGTVVAWGGNESGQSSPPQNLSRVVGIAAGHKCALALTEDGSVVAWGRFMGTGSGSYAASVPAGVDNVIGIACGFSHAVALRSDGTIMAWGDSLLGQTNVPAGLHGCIGVAAAGAHSLALKADGTITGWGSNQNGESIPPADLANVWLISAGPFRCLAMVGSSPPKFTLKPSSFGLVPQGFNVSFNSHRGQFCSLLCTESLVNPAWKLVRSTRLSTGSGSILDPSSLSAQKFYRLQTTPQK